MPIIWYSWIWMNIHKSQLFGCLPGFFFFWCFHCSIRAAIPRLVIYKPPGWEVDTTISPGPPGPSSGPLLSAFLRDVLQPRGPLGASHQFGFLHRLDLPSYLDWLILVGFFWLEEYRPKVDYVDSSHSQVENKHPKKDTVWVDFSDSTVGFVNFFGI